MKLVLGVLCLTLLLEGYSCVPLKSKNARKPLAMNTLCVQLAVRGSQTDEKSPILLLHGIFNFKETWYPLIEHLAMHTGREVCASDLRNHGESPWSNDFDTTVMAKDVELLLETLQFKKVVLLGHSIGGKTAVQFALTNPEKVEKLIVEDMRPNSLRDDPSVQNMINSFKDIGEDAMKAIPKGATDAEAKKAVYKFFVEMFKKLNETLELDERAVNHYPIKCTNGKCRWTSNMKLLTKAILDFKKIIPLSKGIYKGPSLFIYGERSPFRVGDAKEEILQLFPNAKLFEVKNVGHRVNASPISKQEVLEFILHNRLR